jgi:hypothetical protein
VLDAFLVDPPLCLHSSLLQIIAPVSIEVRTTNTATFNRTDLYSESSVLNSSGLSNQSLMSYQQPATTNSLAGNDCWSVGCGLWQAAASGAFPKFLSAPFLPRSCSARLNVRAEASQRPMSTIAYANSNESHARAFQSCANCRKKCIHV